MLGTFNLTDAIAYLTEGAVRMQILRTDFVRLDPLAWELGKNAGGTTSDLQVV